ncbi:leucine-rich repeat-containing protein kinase family protein [Nemorincola caseinilytica]|uniref:Leucine-rich repeat-containing protein kinase family protein n=1 Tax=Nemorincola caseinilytica TaxID=2054315 RepID=A0ABP8N829_9BACT
MHTLAQLRNGDLAGTTILKLSEDLTHFPEEIFALADTLEVLDLSRNRLSELPPDLGRLRKLRILFCSENPFTVLPEVLADLPALDIVGFKANKIETVPQRALNPNIRWLILTDNRIASLPGEIGKCHRMQKLMLAGNRLSELPQELSNCRHLALLRISANRLTALPQWLLSMPRLAWLAFSGNLLGTGTHGTSVPHIAWPELDVHHILGEGASGVIYKAVWLNGCYRKDVAVKLFKGAVTSDGLPQDEMDTFMAAGTHPGLVGLIGQVIQHPDGKNGLVMELISPRFCNLGLPPTFATCTRDVFKEGTTLSVAQVLKVARTIASVAQQLHGRGIMHGDLYAHNTLIDDEATTLLGDLGAASFYDIADAPTAYALERIEICALGYLLDDLLSLCHTPGPHTALVELEKMRDACLLPEVGKRPGFSALIAALGGL